jgi:hypothetical protein
MQAQLAFRVANSPAKPLVRMRLVRDRTVEPPTYSFDLDAPPGAAPQCVATLIHALRPAEERIASAQDGAKR